jgi:hypothetical protein
LLFGRFPSAPDTEVRWHVAQILPRIVSTDADKTRAFDAPLAYLADDSGSVKTCAMQGLADLARGDAKLRGKVLPRLKELTRHGTPAMRARGRKWLAELDAA